MNDLENDDADVTTDPIAAIDVVLVIVTIPLFLFVVMFLTSGGMTVLQRARSRRLLCMALLVVEALTAAILILIFQN